MILKRSLARSVRLEPGVGGAPPSVVKRFESRSLAAATLDRARALREHRMLVELSSLGIPVPRPLALARDGAAWEVRMEWIAGAHPLAPAFERCAPWPAPPERLARELGRLLARLHAAGVDHPDLHAGNALVDARGRAYAIDFHKARRVRRASAKRALRDLSRLAAGAREGSSPRFRARFLLAWWRALPPDLRERIAPPRRELRDFAARIERDARARRIAVVDARRARWTRDGRACRLARDGDSDLIERAELPRGVALEIERARARPGAPAWQVVRLDASGADALVLGGASWRDVRGAWLASARLDEHQIAVARPLAAARGPHPFAAFELPAGARPATVEALGARRAAFASLGELFALLFDRGVWPVASAAPILWLDARGTVLLAAPRELEVEPREASGPEVVRALALAGLELAQLSRGARAALAAGVLAATPLGRARRAELRASLLHG